MFDPDERRFVEAARVGRLATADSAGRPSVVPVCYAVSDGDIVSAIDEKPQSVDADELRRSHDIRTNPRVALVIDRYDEDWSQLGWVQVRGTATHCVPADQPHSRGVAALREKYDQYADHDLGNRPLIRITPRTVRSWGVLEPGPGG